jgi:predicted Zn-dependent peptidase
LQGRHDLVGGRRQVHLGWVGAGFASDDPRRVPLALAVCLLDGQGGRLFHELRERLGLAYEIWASSSAGLDGGTLRVGAATDPARADAAARALRGALEDLAERPPTPDEHARACRMMLGRAALDAQRAASRAASLASRTLFGVPLTRAELSRAVHATDGAAVAHAVRDVLQSGLAELRVVPPP